MKSDILGLAVLLGLVALNNACEDDSSGGTPLDSPSADAPVIQSVNGDGSDSSEPGAAPNRVGSLLDVRGENFTAANVSLAAIGSNTVFQRLAIGANSTAERLLVSLPRAVTPGSYTLTVATALGQAAVDINLLQGEPGVCDASACAAGGSALPGASATTVLKLQSSTAANLGKGIAANGIELIENRAERDGDGLFVVALDRASHAVARGALAPRNFGSSEADQLAGFLGIVDVSVFLVLVSRGDISTLMNAEVQASGEVTTIGDLLVGSFGAPPSVRDVAPGDSIILVAHEELGDAGASYALSSTGLVQTAVLLVDNQITGANASDVVGENAVTARELAPNSVGASEIAEGAVGSSKVAVDAISSRELAPNSVGASEIIDGAVTTSKVAEGAIGFSQLNCYRRIVQSVSDDIVLTVGCEEADDFALAGGCSFGGTSADPGNSAIAFSRPDIDINPPDGWECQFTGPPRNGARHAAHVVCCAD